MGLKSDKEGLEENQMDEVFWCPTLLKKKNNIISTWFHVSLKLTEPTEMNKKSMFEAPRKTNLLKH